MKTLKNFALAIGIIIGMLIVSGQTAWADVKEKKSGKEEQKTALGLNHSQLQMVEFELIENYLEEENLFESDTTQYIYIYTAEGNCVYKGEQGSAKDLVNKSDFLFEKGNITYLIITK